MSAWFVILASPPSDTASLRPARFQHPSKVTHNDQSVPCHGHTMGSTDWVIRCPLVNVYISIENHYSQWENSLFLWPLSIAMFKYWMVWLYGNSWLVEVDLVAGKLWKLLCSHFEPHGRTSMTSTGFHKLVWMVKLAWFFHSNPLIFTMK